MTDRSCSARRRLLQVVLFAALAAGPIAPAAGTLARAQGDASGGAPAARAPATQAQTAQAASVPAFRSRTLAMPHGERTYLVHVPAAAGLASAPPAMVIALHGNGGDGAGMARMSGLHELAEKEGFVVVYPDGVGGSWNYVQGIPGYPEGPDDVAFLSDLGATVEAEFGTDPSRRYVVGYSNGGFMAQRLACAAADAFAGFVSVAAGGFGGLVDVCGGDRAGSVALIHGTADANVPWDGLRASVPGGVVYITWPLPETFAFWAGRAGCAAAAERRDLPGDAETGVTAVVRLELHGCRDGRQVLLVALIGGGHGWPTGPAVDAAATAWSFLRDQALP